MTRPIVTRGLILHIPATRFHPPVHRGDAVPFRFPAFFNPSAGWQGGRVVVSYVEQIDAGIVRLRVLLAPTA
jgi:hypothetical protein